jgi:hypothetical protein
LYQLPANLSFDLSWNFGKRKYSKPALFTALAVLTKCSFLKNDKNKNKFQKQNLNSFMGYTAQLMWRNSHSVWHYYQLYKS